MDERDALKKMICKDEDALAWFIDRYAPYVSTIIYNILGSFVDSSDLEEVASDVFLTLWNNAKSVNPGKVKAYLGGIARNKAKEYTRKIGTELSDENLEHDFEKREQAKYIQEAVLALNAPEREIFLRYYFFYQPIATIATEMNLEPANVKTKLYRGRKRLKEILENGGYTVET